MQSGSPFRSSYAQPVPPQPSSPFFQPPAQSFAGPQFGGGANGWGLAGSASKPPGQQGYASSGPSYGSTSTQPFAAPGHPGSSHGHGLAPGNQQTDAPRHYLPGYLSGGALAQSQATPPQPSDDRAWNDSPSSRQPVSASPVSRFGGQSLFGPRDGSVLPKVDSSAHTLSTPSRSPKAGLFARELPKPRVEEMDEDAPPIESLGEMDGNDSLSISPGKQPQRSNFESSYANTQPSNPSPSLEPSTLPPPAAGASINVFGFPSEALSMVISHFAQFGEVIATTPNTEGGNWITITYAEPWSAIRAARRNGEVLGGVLMLGVKLLDEDLANGNGLGVVQPTTNPARPASAPTGTSTPSGIGRPINIINASAFKQPVSTPTRLGFFSPAGATPSKQVDPHASLFADKSRQTGVLPPPSGGQGLMARASDMIFGW